MANLLYTTGQNHHNILVNRNDNKLYSFGRNQYGQLGLGDNIDRTTPTLIDFEFDGTPTCIQTGWYHSIILTNTGKTYSFGYNGNGQLGLGDFDSRNVPTLMTFQFDGNPTIAWQGDHYTLILTDNNKVYSFGWNNNGQLGLGDTDNRNIPTLIDFEFDGNPVKVQQGNWHSLILTDTNKIYVFGDNRYGQLGLGDFDKRLIPTLLDFEFDGYISNIQQGGNHSMILTNIGKIYTFGYNIHGQLGLGDTDNRNTPTLLDFEFDGIPSDIQLGQHQSLILTNKNKLYSFGQNNYGQLGLEDNIDRYVPTLIDFPFDGKPVDIQMGDYHSIVFTDTDKVYSFGRNINGQLGVGDIEDKNVPTLIEDFSVLTPYVLTLSQNLLEAGFIEVNGEKITMPYSKIFEQNSIINIKQVPDDRYEFVKWNEL